MQIFNIISGRSIWIGNDPKKSAVVQNKLFRLGYRFETGTDVRPAAVALLLREDGVIQSTDRENVYRRGYTTYRAIKPEVLGVLIAINKVRLPEKRKAKAISRIMDFHSTKFRTTDFRVVSSGRRVAVIYRGRAIFEYIKTKVNEPSELAV